MVRLGVSSTFDPEALPQIGRYNFSNNIMVNLSGELVLVVIVLAVTIVVRVGSIFVNSERLRQVKTVMRPLWNGFFMALLPQLGTFAGFGIRMLDTSGKVINGMGSVCLFIVFVLFLVQLWFQIRGITTKVEYIEDTRYEIGLATRINYR